MAQIPWHPIQVRGTIDFLGSSSDTCVRARINEDGNLGNPNLGTTCSGIADTWEFNPLKATDRYGEDYRFQDPLRGQFNLICPTDVVGDS